jgi:hypothetical protein
MCGKLKRALLAHQIFRDKKSKNVKISNNFFLGATNTFHLICGKQKHDKDHLEPGEFQNDFFFECIVSELWKSIAFVT